MKEGCLVEWIRKWGEEIIFSDSNLGEEKTGSVTYRKEHDLLIDNNTEDIVLLFPGHGRRIFCCVHQSLCTKKLPEDKDQEWMSVRLG